jgi:uncharacterized protein with von Willebrand factor type A (vWA) domain
MEEIGVPEEPTQVAVEAAGRVVFVCDATGTMLGLKFKLVQREVGKAIESLAPSQAFNLIFFRGGVNELEWARSLNNKLEPATPDNKRRARDFVATFQVVGKGTNPLPALRQALNSKPDVVYFLTDGEFNNVVSYEQVVAEVRKLNARKSVRVNTIAFMSDDEKAEQVLMQIARENGGRYKKVSDRDLK